MARSDSDTRRRARLTRLLASGATSLLAVTLVVRLWPAPSGASEPEALLYASDGQEVIQIDEIVPTRQAERRPPPPAPLPPVVVPDDVILDDEPIVWEDANLLADAFGEDERQQDGDAEAAEAPRAPRPDTDPRILLNAVARYTPEAREEGVQAEVRVEVMIDAAGRVQEAAIVGRWLAEREGGRRAVERLGFGLEDAALDAARRSRFRPAEVDGEPVAARYAYVIRFSN
jgi:outer membrane biosynthesis protein TonB